MKIRVTDSSMDLNGLIFDAVISPNKQHAYIFDNNNMGWFLSSSSFEIVENDKESSHSNLSLIQSIGDKPKRIEIEF